MEFRAEMSIEHTVSFCISVVSHSIVASHSSSVGVVSHVPPMIDVRRVKLFCAWKNWFEAGSKREKGRHARKELLDRREFENQA